MANGTYDIRGNIDESLAPDPIEAALMDLARAIQLTLSMHQTADSRFHALAKHVDRPGSPLENDVAEVYPSGSFAIHAPTRSEIKRDQHDVDAVIEILVEEDADPETVLDKLYTAITGTTDETYRGLKVERNSRCITVHYSDGVCVDLMPVVRLANTPERVANLFNHKQDTGESYHKQVNPKGFANHFNTTVERSAAFAQRFDTRRALADGASFAERFQSELGMNYEVLAEKAETQPLPDYLPLDQKSPRVVALQILKHFRDKRFRKHDDHKGTRKPPSVILAALALDAPPVAPTLTDEVITVATTIRNAIVNADRVGLLLEVRNPAHWPDLFTDRWPGNRGAQQLWAADLQHLVSELQTLRAEGFTPASIKRVFDDLFGSEVGDYILEEHFRVQNKAVLETKSFMTETGSIQSPALPAPAVRTSGKVAAAASASLITPARASTNMGGVIPDDDH